MLESTQFSFRKGNEFNYEKYNPQLNYGSQNGLARYAIYISCLLHQPCSNADVQQGNGLEICFQSFSD